MTTPSCIKYYGLLLHIQGICKWIRIQLHVAFLLHTLPAVHMKDSFLKIIPNVTQINRLTRMRILGSSDRHYLKGHIIRTENIKIPKPVSLVLSEDVLFSPDIAGILIHVEPFGNCKVIVTVYVSN